MEIGLTHIYCGDGKGKTTCAAGLAVRCAGAGGNVLWFQFLKKDSSSERKSLELLENIDLLPGYDKMKFTFKMTEEEKQSAKDFFQEKLLEIENIVHRKNYDMVVLDEIIGAINLNIILEEQVINFLKRKPKGLEVVLTGREPSEQLCKLADYISDIKKIKHPYDNGIMARHKIEY